VLDGHVLVDAHMHVGKLSTVSPAWHRWAGGFGDGATIERVYDGDGVIIPERFSEYLDAEGVDTALLFSEYSPKVAGLQPIEDLLPLAKHDPRRIRLVANINPHLHFPVADELERQLGLGAVALKLHPVHGGYRANDRALYPAYEVCRSRRIPVIVHCGTSNFPGSMNSCADPVLLDEVLRDFPALDIVLAHGAAAGGTTPRPSSRCPTRTCGSSCPGCRPSGCPSTTPGTTSPG
jgi:predicted TIM-barrel fold metal-dependent hydrolase